MVRGEVSKMYKVSGTSSISSTNVEAPVEKEADVDKMIEKVTEKNDKAIIDLEDNSQDDKNKEESAANKELQKIRDENKAVSEGGLEKDIEMEKAVEKPINDDTKPAELEKVGASKETEIEAKPDVPIDDIVNEKVD